MIAVLELIDILGDLLHTLKTDMKDILRLPQVANVLPYSMSLMSVFGV